MSTDTTFQVNSHGSGDTEKLGVCLASLLQASRRGGQVIELRSDLGGGKTTFVRGLMRGLNSSDHVSSPTFTVSKLYTCQDGRQVVHFDFYRLSDPAFVKEALTEAMSEPTTICVIEWAGVIQDVLPKNRIFINIERTADSQDSRLITVQASQKVIKGLKQC